ncbi:MAG: nucleotidyltransferase domain-containing protein [Candidatus Omnitrophota bacterium]
MLTRDEILKTIKEHRNDIKRFGVREIALFGSHARNEAVGDSDMDFIVVLEKKSFDAYMDLKFYLEDLFRAC